MILVTGASGGVGTALCLELAARGEDLALTARDRGRLEALAERVRAAGGTATVHPCDLRDQEAVAELAAEVLALHGAPSAVVSLAGRSLRRSLADTIGRPHDLVRLTGTNMLGPTALLLALLAPMSRAGGGRLLVATSASARIPTPGWAAYGASKAGMDAWLRAIRPEAEQAGVRITVVELPLVATAMARYLVSTPMDGVLVARPGMALLPCHRWSGGCCRPVERHALTADRDMAQHC